MKKIVVVPFCICLLLIILSGYYIYTRYIVQIEAEKELLMSYASDVQTQMAGIEASTATLPFIVKPIVGKKAMSEKNFNLYAGNISLLEKFYMINDNYLKGISVYDQYGDVFNIYSEQYGVFIEDTYKSRVVNVLRSEPAMVVDKNTYYLVRPVFYGDTLAGNVAVNLDMDSIQKKLFNPFLEKPGIWPSAIFGQDKLITFPVEKELVLSKEKDILKQMEERKSGFFTGKIKSEDFSVTVLSYYVGLSVPEYVVGVVFSSNISPIILSSLLVFIVVCVILLSITILVITVLRRMVLYHKAGNKRKDQQIGFMRSLFYDLPVGILVSRRNNLLTINKCAHHLLDGYLTNDDTGKDMGQISFPPGFFGTPEQDGSQEWTNTFEYNGHEKCLSRKQISVDIDGDTYIIDAFWDITLMEQSRKNTVRSEIAKSELLSRISNDLKKPLTGINDAAFLLTQQQPDEPAVAHIRELSTCMSELIDMVQDFGDIEAGRVIPDEIPFNLISEIKKVTDAYNDEVQQKGISMHAHIASSAVRNIVGDPQRFRQVLDQLLCNAVRFTNEGEIRISLETTDLQGGKILIKCSVEDTGTGMSKQKLKNLFSLELRARDDGESIGLGVIVAKKLVNIMGGTIRAASPSPISTHPEAPGVQFSFTIQCYADTRPDKQFDFSSITSYNQINVLLISSTADHVQHLNNYLGRKGVHVDLFFYNKESSDLLINKLIIDQSRYHIVVIEVDDSETGFVIAEKVHKKGLTKQCLYVLVDPNHQKGNYVRSRTLFMDYYLVKDGDVSNFDMVFSDHFTPLFEKGNRSMEHVRKDLRILMTENNSLSQSVASLIFSQLGYEVDFAQSALDMIARMNCTTYDIIFIDLKVPPTDGFVLVSILREKGYKLPVIAMTSTLTKENIKSIYDNGLNGYVPKPLNPESIRGILMKWFS